MCCSPRVYALAGEREAALDILERVLAMPAPFTARLLSLDEGWAPLRGSERFERLVATSSSR